MEQERQYNLNNNVDWSTTSGQSRDYIECSNNSSRDGVLQKTPSGSFSQPAGGDVDEEGGGVSGGRAAQGTGTRAGSSDRKRRDEREANRIHCRETRERKRQKEKLLREEVETLLLYKSIVEEGPDLFSLHRVDIEAPFSFLCANYYRRLQLSPEDVLGRPLASIVDPLDVNALRNAVYAVMTQDTGLDRGGPPGGKGGTLIHLRVACGGLICQASMTLVLGTQGLIVVTRLYDI